MNISKLIVTIFITLLLSPSLNADTRVIYDVLTATGETKQVKIEMSGRFMRLETNPPHPEIDYTLVDGGRLLMFDIDTDKKQFQVTRMGRLYWPEENDLLKPRFKPERKKQVVANVPCQEVVELAGHHADHASPIARHCMAPNNAMRINPRETKNLSRLFMSFRRMGKDWYGVATPNERQVSVASEYQSGAKLKLRSINTLYHPTDHFKIPPAFKRLKPDLPEKMQ